MSISLKHLFSTLALLALAALGTAARAEDGADPDAGEVVFKRCMTCHQVGPTAKNIVGPVLNGIVGRPAGTYPGYRYSAANRDSGVVWDKDTLTEYLRGPRRFMPGTKMTFPGLQDDEEIANLIAFLQRFNDSGEIVEPTP